MFAKINHLISLVLIFFIGCVNLIFAVQDGCFRAAVYEHVHQYSDNSQEKVQLNLDAFETATIAAASNSSDIVVFPEYGIFFGVNNREDAGVYMEEIPNPSAGSYTPCDESEQYGTTHPILFRLSCLAKHNNIYIAADMGDSVPCDTSNDDKCPSDGHYYFNTAVLFDKTGKLIAKYHKMHLFGEYAFDAPPEPEIISIDTPIGKLGLFICFDLIFKLPAIELVEQSGVDTMIFPTWWFDEFPFLSAAQYQEAWAITNNVNLITSNIHMPSVGSMGSGIFSGNKGAIMYTNTPDGEPKLLISDIPISTKSNINCNPNAKKIYLKSSKLQPKQPPKVTTYKNKVMNMKNTAHILLNAQNSSQQLRTCLDGVCCQLNYTLTTKQFKTGETYYMIIANRTRDGEVGVNWCEEFCALVRCDLDNSNACGAYSIDSLSDSFNSVSISADFSTKYVYPSVVSNKIELIDRSDWTFTATDSAGSSHVELKIDNFNKPLLVLGLYGRCYDRDPQTEDTPNSEPNGSYSLVNATLFTNLSIFISIMLLAMRRKF